MTGHRVSVAHVRIAERVRISNGNVTKTTNLIRCDRCDEVVTLRRGNARDVWVHGMPDGMIVEVTA